MDNFSQETEEEKINQQSSENQEINDIEFEEVLDIDETQEKINQDSLGMQTTETSEEQISDSETKLETDLSIVYGNAKKYVIYINLENIDFIESLSTDERRKVINKILQEQKEFSIKDRASKARSRFLKHLLLAVFTFIIFFPIVFIYVNKALLISIDNYEQAKENFSKLYKEHGKIKREKQ